MITITTENVQIGQLNQYSNQSNIWSLRMLLSLRREIVESHWKELLESNLPIIDNDLVSLELELKKCEASREQKIRNEGSQYDGFNDKEWTWHTAETIREAWQDRLSHYQKAELKTDNGSVYENVEMLGEFVSLNQTEKELLKFALLANRFTPLNKYLSKFKLDSSSEDVLEINTLSISMVSTMLNIPEVEISEAVDSDGKLSKVCGMRMLDETAFDENMGNIFHFQSFLEQLLMRPHKNRDAFVGKILYPTPPAKLDISDFDHVKKHIGILDSYLSGVFSASQKGVNILIYGKPGTGKNQLASVLAELTDSNLFAVPCVRRTGAKIERQDRFSAYQLCQSLAAGIERAIILFDEVEDVFVTEYKEASGKAWVNSMLEGNTVPSIWLTNDISEIDPAYLRRFDYVLEMPEVPHEVRLSVAARYFDGLDVEQSWLKSLSMQDGISPAQIERAARVVNLAQGETSPFDSAKIAETVLECNARAVGGKFTLGNRVSRTGYDIAYLNTSVDVSRIIVGLRHTPKATFCFYGAPGTGKTELAKHMAEQLGKKLLVKRASDVFGMYVGQTEKNIAQIFRQATEEGAILMLDEADSFLADRRGAVRSWEVSNVNELLTWMEEFDGIFICTTNLIEKIDQAALRRFAFKVRFDYLKPEQKRNLFKQELQRMSAHAVELDDAILRKVEALPSLSPGDFAAVSRQRAVLGESPSALELLVALEEECKAKGATLGKMGF